METAHSLAVGDAVLVRMYVNSSGRIEHSTLNATVVKPSAVGGQDMMVNVCMPSGAYEERVVPLANVMLPPRRSRRGEPAARLVDDESWGRAPERRPASSRPADADGHAAGH